MSRAALIQLAGELRTNSHQLALIGDLIDMASPAPGSVLDEARAAVRIVAGGLTSTAQRLEALLSAAAPGLSSDDWQHLEGVIAGARCAMAHGEPS